MYKKRVYIINLLLVISNLFLLIYVYLKWYTFYTQVYSISFFNILIVKLGIMKFVCKYNWKHIKVNKFLYKKGVKMVFIKYIVNFSLRFNFCPIFEKENSIYKNKQIIYLL